MIWYLILKYIHVLSAIMMIGGSFANGIMELNLKQKKKFKNNDDVYTIMNQVRLINKRLVLPGTVSLLITGLLIVYEVNYSIHSFWIFTSLLTMVAIFVLFFMGKKYEDRLENQARNDEIHNMGKTHKIITLIGLSASVVILFILFLMIVKPV